MVQTLVRILATATFLVLFSTAAGARIISTDLLFPKLRHHLLVELVGRISIVGPETSVIGHVDDQLALCLEERFFHGYVVLVQDI